MCFRYRICFSSKLSTTFRLPYRAKFSFIPRIISTRINFNKVQVDDIDSVIFVINDLFPSGVVGFDLILFDNEFEEIVPNACNNDWTKFKETY